jgi:peptidoglycan/xylan/chitin deacetylase (PgdA/CDA1 family)
MIGLPILTYHSIDSRGSVLSTSPEWFAATLSALHAEGFVCVDLAGWVASGRPAIDRGFALAFDDGLSSLAIVAEAIARHRFSATAFLVTGRMGGDNGWPGQSRGLPTLDLLGWSDLDDLRSAGFRFAAHTVSHPRLSDRHERDQAREILDSRREVEDRTGSPCRLFAYPYGDAPASAREIVSRHFSAGFGTRLAYATADEDPACLSRVDSYYLRSPRDLDRLLSGRWTGRLRVRRLARAVRRAIAVA